MKKYISIISAFLAASVFCSAVYAQENSDNELEASFEENQIVLPDVTVTVSGESEKAGNDAVIDFSNVLPVSAEIEKLLPVLPDAASPAEANVIVSNSENTSVDKSVYIEGLFGGGYPGTFTGDFSIYKNTGDEPFLLKFSHESINAYGLNSADKGFYDSNTLLHGEKISKIGDFDIGINADYNRNGYGLQSKSEELFDINSQNLLTSDYAIWKLPKGFELKLGLNAVYYACWNGLKNPDAVTSLLKQEVKIKTTDLNPSFNASWHNDNFYIDLNSAYEFEAILNKTDDFASYAYDKTSLIHRGDFTVNGVYTYENQDKNIKLSAGGSGGVVCGNKIGSMKVIPLGTLSFDYEGKYGKELKTFTVSLKGGLDSYLPEYSELAGQFKYTNNPYLPTETSVWFADLSTVIPIGSYFSVDFAAGIKKPLFGNGLWEADYESTALSSKLYTLKQFDDYVVNSDLGFSFIWNTLSAGAVYKANWIHVPSDEAPHLVSVNFAYDAEDSLWGADVQISEPFGTNDYTPLVNAGAYYRLKNTLKVALQVEDAVKLCTGKNRMWASSMFEQSAGSVSLLLKFFF